MNVRALRGFHHCTLVRVTKIRLTPKKSRAYVDRSSGGGKLAVEARPLTGILLGRRAPHCTRRDNNQGDKDGQATLTTGEESFFRVCDRPRAVARSVLTGCIREKRKQVTERRRLEARVQPGLADHRIARQGIQEGRDARAFGNSGNARSASCSQ